MSFIQLFSSSSLCKSAIQLRAILYSDVCHCASAKDGMFYETFFIVMIKMIHKLKQYKWCILHLIYNHLPLKDKKIGETSINGPQARVQYT